MIFEYLEGLEKLAITEMKVPCMHALFQSAGLWLMGVRLDLVGTKHQSKTTQRPQTGWKNLRYAQIVSTIDE